MLLVWVSLLDNCLSFFVFKFRYIGKSCYRNLLIYLFSFLLLYYDIFMLCLFFIIVVGYLYLCIGLNVSIV